MKINLVGPSYPFRGGIANFNDSLFSALGKNHDVGITGFSLQYPSLLFPGKSQFEKDGPKVSTESERLINTINPLSWHTTAGRIAKAKPDCIIVHYWMPFFAPALGSIIRGVKRRINTTVIGVLHNIKPHETMIGGKWLNKYFLKSCDGFITMSSAVQDELENLGINKPAKQIPHPVYDIFGESVSRKDAIDYLDLDTEQNHLLFFGIIRSYKGLDLLIETFSSPRLSHLNLKLLVAGEFYENEKKYLDMAEERGLGEKIVFTRNFVPREEVSCYFAASDLVVLPYLSATQSGVTQIAYHFNKPVVVTNVGGLKEVVSHGVTGYVCEKDPDEIAAAIADFFENNREAEFAENIRSEKKRRFSWDSMARGIEDLTAEITGLSKML